MVMNKRVAFGVTGKGGANVVLRPLPTAEERPWRSHM
jgi:hypothetical protein